MEVRKFYVLDFVVESAVYEFMSVMKVMLEFDA
jgi:hypothetical protein